ncbi:MAG: phage major tail tube protein, partial [Nanopusillaceae archaeon]
MAIEVNKVTNARVYINGTDFIAKAEEIDLPKVKFKTTETKGLALIGETDLPTVLDKLEARIKFNS